MKKNIIRTVLFCAFAFFVLFACEKYTSKNNIEEPVGNFNYQSFNRDSSLDTTANLNSWLYYHISNNFVSIPAVDLLPEFLKSDFNTYFNQLASQYSNLGFDGFIDNLVEGEQINVNLGVSLKTLPAAIFAISTNQTINWNDFQTLKNNITSNPNLSNEDKSLLCKIIEYTKQWIKYKFDNGQISNQNGGAMDRECTNLELILCGISGAVIGGVVGAIVGLGSRGSNIDILAVAGIITGIDIAGGLCCDIECGPVNGISASFSCGAGRYYSWGAPNDIVGYKWTVSGGIPAVAVTQANFLDITPNQNASSMEVCSEAICINGTIQKKYCRTFNTTQNSSNWTLGIYFSGPQNPTVGSTVRYYAAGTAINSHTTLSYSVPWDKGTIQQTGPTWVDVHWYSTGSAFVQITATPDCPQENPVIANLALNIIP